MAPPMIPIPKETILRRLYSKEKKSTYKIAMRYDVSQSTVLTWLVYYDIPRRKPGGKKGPRIELRAPQKLEELLGLKNTQEVKRNMTTHKITGIKSAVSASRKCNNGAFVLERNGHVHFHELVSATDGLFFDDNNSMVIGRITNGSIMTMKDLRVHAEIHIDIFDKDEW